MIAVVFGTTGELIKLAPVLRRPAGRGPPAAAHHHRPAGRAAAGRSSQDFGLPPADVWLARGFRGRDLERPWQIPAWAATVAGRSCAGARGCATARVGRATPDHGPRRHDDHASLGALDRRVPARARSLHVEAGMRSGDWRNPFPEELTRRTVAARLAARPLRARARARSPT